MNIDPQLRVQRLRIFYYRMLNFQFSHICKMTKLCSMVSRLERGLIADYCDSGAEGNMKCGLLAISK